jgi:UDP-N-acetylglucosamine--N-acetylmuramyl-(pentapeptide) pyrophosphoryl-undecaprenol N-acetylglucosamine transferase
MGAASRPERPIMIAAGGTGGHLFPAQALADELASRGHVIHLMTDRRVDRHAHAFPAASVHEIQSATLSPRRPLALVPSMLKLYQGYRKARSIMRQRDAAAAVGFGGYPTLPPLMAAVRLGVPTCIHEQNSVLGRANRVLASRVDRIAGSFPNPKNLDAALSGKFRLTGNPVRRNAKRLAAAPYTPPGEGEPFQLLIFGGSQGARVMSQVVPEAVRAWTGPGRLSIVQQCREEDLAAVRAIYEDLGIKAEIEPFFNDLPQKIATAHLVICRSGASTIGELSVIGRPAILVPLPHSLDQDQRENALRIVNAGGAWLVDQHGFTPDQLAAMLESIRNDPQSLAVRAEAALAFGEPDAERALADVVEEIVALA